MSVGSVATAVQGREPLNASPTILCFGEALWDVGPSGRVPGGAPMNVALRLARLGARVRFVSRVGSDALGTELLEYLAASGLPVEEVQFDEQAPTGRVLVDVADPHDVRYEICAPAAWDFIEAEPAAPDVLVYGSLAARHAVSHATLRRLLDVADLKVFDVNLRPPHDRREEIEPLLARADWVKLNEDELAVVCRWLGLVPDPANPSVVLEELARRLALDVVCVTRGPRGAWMWKDGRLHTHPGLQVDVVDTVGCGDAFLACLLWDLLAGERPDEALGRACALGALVAMHEGANPDVGEAEIRALRDLRR